MEAHGRIEAAEAEVKHLKGMLAKGEAELALEKKKRVVKVAETKKVLAKVERIAKERVTKAKKEAKERSTKVEH